MNEEYLKIELEKAVDLVQLISEDLESNFFGSDVDNAVKARATMTVSVLCILTDHLRNIGKAVKA